MGNPSAADHINAIARRQEEMHQAQLTQDSARQAETPDGAAEVAAPNARPTPPLPDDVLAKPGVESDLRIAPEFMAPDYKGSEKLKDKVAIVTGGDSGIGRAVAVLYAREGADVVIVYLNEHGDAQVTCDHIRREGRRALLIAGDIRDKDFCRQVVKKTVESFGRIDILVNNAAFQLHAHEIGEITEDRLDETFRTNVFGMFHLTQAAVPEMPSGAAIINSGSVVGLEGSGELLDYAATKGAIHAFTKSLAHNLLEKGIRVNAVAPGPVWTPLNPADKAPDDIRNFGAGTDMKRPAQPDELSPAYVFLAAPCCSSYINGIVLPVTGSIG
ncbi:SDR family oxidoreductase [Dongia sp.]|uniref:SDR family oxidoreductase n=1 Tax=Dongia sp. TaxID=1977262 RepID=UPI0035B1EA1A